MKTQLTCRIVCLLMMVSLLASKAVPSPARPRGVHHRHAKVTEYNNAASRPFPPPTSLYKAAVETVVDYVVGNGEASRADVMSGRYFRPSKPAMPSDLEDSGNYIADERVSLKPYITTRNNAAYSVYFYHGRSGNFEVFKIRRYPHNPDQHTVDLPFTSR